MTGERPSVFFAALAAADARLAAADGDRAAARPTAELLTRAARLLRNDPDIEFVQALWDRAAQFEAIDD